MLRFTRFRRCVFPTLQDCRQKAIEEVDKQRTRFAAAAWLNTGAPQEESASSVSPSAVPDAGAAVKLALPLAGVRACDVLARFTQLTQKAKEAVCEDDLAAIADEARSLSTLRAYLYTQPRISQIHATGLSTIRGWGIPKEEYDELADATKACRDQELQAARDGLCTLLEESNTWSDYIDSIVSFNRKVASVLLLVAGVALFVSMNRLLSGDIVYGVVLGGLSGSLLSLTSRLPGIPLYAGHVTTVISMFSRIGVGLVATILGGSLIAMNVVSVNIPGQEVTLAEVVERCGRGSLPIGQSRAERASGGTAEVSARLQTAASIPDPGRCKTGHMFLLLGLALLLGFSERALPSFERKILPESTSLPTSP